MKKFLSSVISYSVPFIGLAAAGMADRYYDHLYWLLVAYKYCLLLGIINIIVLLITCRIWKNRFDYLIESLIKYCTSNSLAAIMILGTCLSVTLGIVTGVTGLVLWILNIFPLFACLFMIPLWILNKVRRNWFLKENIFYCMLILTIGAVMSSSEFILLTLLDLLPEVNGSVIWISGKIYTHPWLSLMDIWTYVFIYIGEVVLCLIYHLIKISIRRSYSYLKDYLRKPIP